MIFPRHNYQKLLTRILFFFGLSIIFIPFSKGQQAFQSSLTYLEKYQLNPAFGGMENLMSLTASYRSQWQGLDGHPEFIRLSGHVPLYAINGAGGVIFRKEDIGIESNVSALVSYNQVFDLDIALLSVGVRTGFLRKQLSGKDLVSQTGEYTNGGVNHNDPFIPNTSVSGYAPTWGLGLYFFSNNFDFGMVFEDYPSVAVSLEGTAIQKWQSISVHGNYLLNLSDFIKLDIYGLVRTDLTQWQTDVGVRAGFSNNIFSSLQLRGYSERTVDAVSLAVGGRLNKNLLLAYSYDITLSPLRQVSNGAHELLLRYLVDVNIGKKIPEKIIHSPRLYE